MYREVMHAYMTCHCGTCGVVYKASFTLLVRVSTVKEQVHTYRYVGRIGIALSNLARVKQSLSAISAALRLPSSVNDSFHCSVNDCPTPVCLC